MKYWIAKDILGFSIWKEEPRLKDKLWTGYDDPYNTNCVYISDDLVKLLGVSVDNFNKKEIEINI